jgi:hypothetical protein
MAAVSLRLRRDMTYQEFATWCRNTFPAENDLYASAMNGHVSVGTLLHAVPASNDASLTGVLEFLEGSTVKMNALHSRVLVHNVRQLQAEESAQRPSATQVYKSRISSPSFLYIFEI